MHVVYIYPLISTGSRPFHANTSKTTKSRRRSTIPLRPLRHRLLQPLPALPPIHLLFLPTLPGVIPHLHELHILVQLRLPRASAVHNHAVAEQAGILQHLFRPVLQDYGKIFSDVLGLGLGLLDRRSRSRRRRGSHLRGRRRCLWFRHRWDLR